MRLPLCDKNFDMTEGIKNKSKECKQQLLTANIGDFSALLRNYSCLRTVGHNKKLLNGLLYFVIANAKNNTNEI